MNSNGKAMMIGIFVLSLVFGLAGCASDSKTTANATKPADNKATTTENKTTTTTETKTTTAETKPATTGEKIGVAECDEYLDKYEACVTGKVPENMRATFKTSLDQARKSYKDAAMNPQAKSTLASTCKQALETTKQSMAAYSCAW
jgi:hypothetical protein